MLTGATRSRCEWTHRERAGEDAAAKRPEILTLDTVDGFLDNYHAETVYQAMIDAALSSNGE
jgi:hypothetical protein